jgi:prefoldin subunit 5
MKTPTEVLTAMDTIVTKRVREAAKVLRDRCKWLDRENQRIREEIKRCGDKRREIERASLAALGTVVNRDSAGDDRYEVTTRIEQELKNVPTHLKRLVQRRYASLRAGRQSPTEAEVDAAFGRVFPDKQVFWFPSGRCMLRVDTKHIVDLRQREDYRTLLAREEKFKKAKAEVDDQLEELSVLMNYSSYTRYLLRYR